VRRRLAFVVLVIAAVSLTAAAVGGAWRARAGARARAAERHLVAARAAAALCELHLETLAESVRTTALAFEAGPAPPDARLRALYEGSEHFRVVSLLDEEGRPLRPPVYRDAVAAATLPAAAGPSRRHPAVAPTDVDEHLRAVPVDDARRRGLAVSAPFMRGARGPFVVLASSYQVAGESHATGDPCHPGSRHVIAAEIELEWLVKRLRVAAGGPHQVLLLDEQYRVLGSEAPLATVAGLGPARSPQAVTVELPAQTVPALGLTPALGALAPVPGSGWSVLVYAPRWRVVPMMSSLAIVWALASLVVLLGAAATLARRPADPPAGPPA
jgi:hypothetical protein